MVETGRNGNEPPAAAGTTVPSIGPIAGGPPQTTYPLSRIGSGDAPKIVAIVGELRVKLNAKTPMHFGGNDGVFEVVGKVVALVAKVEPGLGVLMHEERGKRADVAQPVVFKDGPFPCHPGIAVERIGLRAHAQADTSSSIRCRGPSAMG